VWPRPFHAGQEGVAIRVRGHLARPAVVASAPTYHFGNEPDFISLRFRGCRSRVKLCQQLRVSSARSVFAHREPETQKRNDGLVARWQPHEGARVMRKHPDFFQRFDLPFARPTSRDREIRHVIFGVVLVIVFMWAFLTAGLHP
jgi:hypothetical protein